MTDYYLLTPASDLTEYARSFMMEIWFDSGRFAGAYNTLSADLFDKSASRHRCCIPECQKITVQQEAARP